MAIEHALRKLRHLYEQMLDGRVRTTQRDIARAARGLLGPAIADIERAIRDQQHEFNTNPDENDDEVFVTWGAHEQEDPDAPEGYEIDYSRTETTETGYRAPLVAVVTRATGRGT